jgi:hypothetical protein
MLVLVLFLILHMLLWNRHRGQRKQLITLSLSVVSYFVLWMLILTVELGGGTYGTDELGYYLEILQAVAGGLQIPYLSSAPRLIEFGSIVMRSSPSSDAIWLRLANIAMYSLTVNLIYVLVYPKLVTWYLKSISPTMPRKFDRQFLVAFIIFACNGIVVWTVIRVLKEPLLLLLIALAIYAIDGALIQSDRRVSPLFSILLVVGAVWGVSGLRSGATYLIGAALVGAILRESLGHSPASHRSIRRYFAILFILAVISGTVYYFRLNILEQLQRIKTYEQLFGNYFGDPTTGALKTGNVWLGYLLSVPRFVLGPGPIRALQQLSGQDVFMVSTMTGDVLILLGALQWWIVLMLVFFKLLMSKEIISQFQQIFLIGFSFTVVAFMHIGTYVFVYAGTGDTRHRAVMYVLLMPLLICISTAVNVTRSARLPKHRLMKASPDVRSPLSYKR